MDHLCHTCQEAIEDLDDAALADFLDELANDLYEEISVEEDAPEAVVECDEE